MTLRSFFVALLCLSFAMASAHTPVGQLSEKEIKTLLCQKWKLATLEGKGKTVDVPASSPEIVLHFLPDGTLNEKAGNKSYKGTWSYNHAKLTVTTVDKDGKENHTLVEITQDFLKMKTKFMGIEVIYGMKKMN